jgi:glutamate/tyrosine decarboxylase-like PLP-dependent enzyme
VADITPLLDLAHTRALDWLARVPTRAVGATATRAQLLHALGGALPLQGAPAADVLDALCTGVEPGLVSTVGPRYFGFVTGGAVPVTVATEWLASAWDQNGALYVMSPAAAVVEDIVSGWVLELLGLPASASVGFVTGCHMANFTCLAAARHEVLRRHGWDVEAQGLQRAPAITVVVGGEVHVSITGALRMLGIGTSELRVADADGQGRMRPDALAAQLAGVTGPVIVCAQAGNVNTGASDPLHAILPIAHAHGAWVHVDGAFGLWAAAVPELAPQVASLSRADSWATDAHKWLNVPYDSGLAIVAHPAPHRAALSLRASYLQRGDDEERMGMDWVPESSRRARGFALYTLIRTLGREGLIDLFRRSCTHARDMAQQLAAVPGLSILNDVVLNQVLVRCSSPRHDGDDDEMTRRVMASIQAEGTCWAGGAVWQGRQVLRISVSNWSTTREDIARSAEAIARAYRAHCAVDASASA